MPVVFRLHLLHVLTRLDCACSNSMQVRLAFVRYRVDQAAVVAGKPNEPRSISAKGLLKMQPRERKQAK